MGKRLPEEEIGISLKRKDGYDMHKVYVKFDSVEQITKFVNVINRMDGNFDLGCGQRTVDAKSLVGVMAMDFSEPIQLRYDSDDKRVVEMLSPFIYRANVA